MSGRRYVMFCLSNVVAEQACLSICRARPAAEFHLGAKLFAPAGVSFYSKQSLDEILGLAGISGMKARPGENLAWGEHEFQNNASARLERELVFCHKAKVLGGITVSEARQVPIPLQQLNPSGAVGPAFCGLL